MKTKSNENGKEDRIEKIFADEKQITKALQRGIREAVEAHRRAGNPIAVWRDGKAVLIETK
jgi:predicted metal-dependent phosphotriesterase family hydrolase